MGPLPSGFANKNTGRTILNKGFGPFKNEFSENMFKRTTYYEYKHI